ncbi:unnamed protein product [Allacma fusca]|uniref:Fatty acid desaturase domain-containing protein n=1 Tax=Allacma fusca TaxID=39272 RepID=A0A8J2JPU4_9HEXA|nr:unnamed protein product [Allacma fusca]
MKYCFLPLVIIFPVLISVYLIGETVLNAFYVAGCLKFIYSSHSTFLINSVAHTWGSRPYDKNITARNNRFVSLFALGEGWHNYHHAFPRDYKTSEFGLYRWNLSAALIDFFACIGWAYDLQKTRPDEIEKRVNRTADKSIHENQLLG